MHKGNRTMNYKLTKSLTAAALLLPGLAAAATTGNAGLFTVVETFEGFDGLVTQGPVALGGGATVTSSIDSTIGAFAVDLGDNGVWGAGDNFAGIGDLSPFPQSFNYDGSMTFSWTTGLTGAGANFSIYQAPAGSAEILLEALAIDGGVLESTTLLVSYGDPLLYNVGEFLGFLRASNDLYGLRISGDGFVVDDLAVIPVPAALPLFAGGLALLGAVRRRRTTLEV
jgi:hypothetical protein